MGLLNPHDPAEFAYWRSHEQHEKALMSNMESTAAPQYSQKCRMQETKAVMKERPLQLLDLPLDVLKTILKEVTHTNDLTTLALTNSILHELVTPLIYSRFDIVWPDGSNTTEPRTGVDALTFGLATLVMRQELFENTVSSHRTSNESDNVTYGQDNTNQRKDARIRRMRRGNWYSEYVKKFSLGNGPPDLVQDYVVTKDTGKLLGTMVALTIARMPNLETFFWDMPTGILRDVWMSLSSLGNVQPQKLEAIHIRFHDNYKAYHDLGLVRSTGTQHQPATAVTMPALVQPYSPVDAGSATYAGRFKYTNHHVESPSFSILPPLRSVSVVDIDELANLDELSLLIGTSSDKLRELRVGMSHTLHSSGLPANSRALQYLGPQAGSAGTLHLLFSGLAQCRPRSRITEYLPDGGFRYTELIDKGNTVETGPIRTFAASEMNYVAKQCSAPDAIMAEPETSIDATSALDTTTIDPALKSPTVTGTARKEDTRESETSPVNKPLQSAGGGALAVPPNKPQGSPELPQSSSGPHPEVLAAWQSRSDRRLELSVLELERHVLSTKLLHEAVDITLLTSLTLLKCTDTPALWQALRQMFAPFRQRHLSILSAPTKAKSRQEKKNGCPQLRRMPASPRSAEQSELTYRLKLKRLHTDTVSPELIALLKETLAPNTLEWLFLQDAPGYKSPVTLSQVYKGPLRRHRGSVTKLLLDSSHGQEKSRERANSARKWMLNRETMSSLLVRQKAPKLRELSISLEYKDWHWFLQQLPNIKTLRSLHVPVIADHVWGPNFSIRDVAMGVVDVINLRKECELAYLAIASKCFEIVETRVRGRERGPLAQGGDDSTSEGSTPTASNHEDEEDDDEQEDDEDEDDDGNGLATPDADEGDADGEGLSSSENEDVVEEGKQIKMKLREILFYDDKISIFKARHGKL